MESQIVSLSVCVLMAIFQVNLGWPVLLELRIMEVVVTTGAGRANLQSYHPLTNQHPNFYRPGGLPVTQLYCRSTEGKAKS